MDSFSVLIADDHQIFRTGLSFVLSAQEDIRLVGVAEHGRDALEKGSVLHPDIMLVDLQMPELNGFEVIKRLKSMGSASKFVVLTSYDDRVHIARALELQVEGYLSKEIEHTELVEALRSVARGERVFSRSVIEAMGTNPAASSFRDMHNFRDTVLTQREIEIIRLIADGHASKNIADILNISVRTVDTHRANIMKKLQATSVADVIRFGLTSALIR